MHHYVLLHLQPTIISLKSNTVSCSFIPPLVLLPYNVDIAKGLRVFYPLSQYFSLCFIKVHSSSLPLLVAKCESKCPPPHIYIYIYIYTYTYTYTHTHTHTHTHTQTDKVRELVAVKMLHISLLNTTVVAFKVLPLGSYALMPAPNPLFKTILELVL